MRRSMTTLLIFACVFCQVSPPRLFCQQPEPQPTPVQPLKNAKAVITDLNGNPVPTEVQAGEALYFSAKQATRGNSPTAIRWHVEPEERAARSREMENGTVLVVPCGRESVTITILQIVAYENTLDYQKITVKVDGGSKPTPTPGPTPGPTPEPPPPTPGPLPTGLKAELKKAYDQYASTLPTADKLKVAAAFRVVGSQVASGSINSVEELLTATADEIRNRVTLQGVIVWLPWRDATTKVVKAQNLPNVKAHAEVWQMISDVLEGK